MRYTNSSTEKPEAQEVKIIGKEAHVYIREDFTEAETEDGGVVYSWVEYHGKFNARKGFELTDSMIEAVKDKAAQEAAKAVRTRRNALLEDTDKDMLYDRVAPKSDAYKALAAYRQALRDIPSQEGFPFDVEWPELAK